MLAAHWLCYYYQVRSTISLHLDRIRQKKGSYQKPPRSYNHSPRSISEHSLVPTLCTLHQGTQEVMHMQETFFNIIFHLSVTIPSASSLISLFTILWWWDGLTLVCSWKSRAWLLLWVYAIFSPWELDSVILVTRKLAAYCNQGAQNILASF